MYKFLPLIIATLSPFIWGLMNSFDKYVISHKVKKPFGFAIVAGLVNLIFGIILALFLKWKIVSLNQMLFPILTGVLFGAQLIIYYLIIQKEDVSKIIGVIYIYPIFVALLSFIFLNEKISIIGYIGMLITITGAIILSTNLKKLKTKIGLWTLFILALDVSFYEFFIKISTNKISELNGLALTVIVAGLVILSCLFKKKLRISFISEFKNIKYSFGIEMLTFLGIFTTYFGMSWLPATIFSSIATIQPLAVLIFEKISDKYFIKISNGESFLKKLFPICLIIIGVILLYINQLR